jgi:hypothetical protein
MRPRALERLRHRLRVREREPMRAKRVCTRAGSSDIPRTAIASTQNGTARARARPRSNRRGRSLARSNRSDRFSVRIERDVPARAQTENAC